MTAAALRPGDRVQLSQEAIRAGVFAASTHCRKGTVVRLSRHDGRAIVLWDGRRSEQELHADYVAPAVAKVAEGAE